MRKNRPTCHLLSNELLEARRLLTRLFDIDLDGDLDALADSAWYENYDGKGNFTQRRFALASPVNSVAGDLDGDGDLDFATNEAMWYENDGTGGFSLPIEIPNSAGNLTKVELMDVGGDGDMDVLSGSARLWSPIRLAWHENRIVGDTNDDGVFDSSDLVRVLMAGEYEDDVPNNSTFDEGDWNGDGDFDSSDLVLAFQAGHYVAAARPF